MVYVRPFILIDVIYLLPASHAKRIPYSTTVVHGIKVLCICLYRSTGEELDQMFIIPIVLELFLNYVMYVLMSVNKFCLRIAFFEEDLYRYIADLGSLSI